MSHRNISLVAENLERRDLISEQAEQGMAKVSSTQPRLIQTLYSTAVILTAATALSMNMAAVTMTAMLD